MRGCDSVHAIYLHAICMLKFLAIVRRTTSISFSGIQRNVATNLVMDFTIELSSKQLGSYVYV